MANRTRIKDLQAGGLPDPEALVRTAYDLQVRHTVLLRDEQYRRFKETGVTPSLSVLVQEAIESRYAPREGAGRRVS